MSDTDEEAVRAHKRTKETLEAELDASGVRAEDVVERVERETIEWMLGIVGDEFGQETRIRLTRLIADRGDES